MSARDELLRAQSIPLQDEDGDEVTLELLPPLPATAIDQLEIRIGTALPIELRELLPFCSGVEGCLDQVDFAGRNMAFEQPEIFPHGLPIASDGFGNFWVLDCTRYDQQSAPIFFACHDAPVILFQSPTLEHFIRELISMQIPPHQSLLNEVHYDKLFEVWRRNPRVIDHADALPSADPAVSQFASTLDSNFQIIDLRQAETGMGFSWGRYGPNTEVRRDGENRIFAYARPAKTKRGFLAQLFGPA